MTNFPQFTIQQMLDAGVHFGHKEMLWNPKMAPFIFGSRNRTHIIDLQKTAALLNKALKVVSEASKRRGAKILFVGTKRQAGEAIKEAALKCGQFYVNHRWLGGMLTNWPTVSKSIKTLEELEVILRNAQSGEETRFNKKELLDFDRKRQKLENSLGGIRNMKGKPDLIFIIDTNKEEIAVKEAKTLGVPVIAVVDTNSQIDDIDYVIPGNDDAAKAISFYCKMISDAVLHGVEEFLAASGVELGKIEDISFNAPKADTKVESTVANAAISAEDLQEKLGSSDIKVITKSGRKTEEQSVTKEEGKAKTDSKSTSKKGK